MSSLVGPWLVKTEVGAERGTRNCARSRQSNVKFPIEKDNICELGELAKSAHGSALNRPAAPAPYSPALLHLMLHGVLAGAVTLLDLDVIGRGLFGERGAAGQRSPTRRRTLSTFAVPGRLDARQCVWKAAVTVLRRICVYRARFYCPHTRDRQPGT